MKILGLILAREKSKRLPNKNIRDFCGKPLIAWTIESVLESGITNRLLVSTDSNKIASISKKYGAEVPELRISSLSGATISPRMVVNDALSRWLDKETAVAIFQTTTPLRIIEDIHNAYEVFRKLEFKGEVKTVTESPFPKEWLWEVKDNGKIIYPRECNIDIQSQLLKKRYIPNGAVYLQDIEYFSVHGFTGPLCYASLMPQERSIDIDTEFDFQIAEFLMRQRLSAEKNNV